MRLVLDAGVRAEPDRGELYPSLAEASVGRLVTWLRASPPAVVPARAKTAAGHAAQLDCLVAVAARTGEAMLSATCSTWSIAPRRPLSSAT